MTYKCQSYYDDNDKLQDCTCGKCEIQDIIKELNKEHGYDDKE